MRDLKDFSCTFEVKIREKWQEVMEKEKEK
jgi:hypothetical protein